VKKKGGNRKRRKGNKNKKTQKDEKWRIKWKKSTKKE
jgi:hypothetical protein